MHPTPDLKEGQASLELICHLPQVHMDVGCNGIFSKPPSVEKK
jgi:hypothetical protein